MDITRRKLLLSTLFGAGGVGLRALATGLPLSVFTRPRAAHAESNPAPDACTNAQYLYFLTSSSGDPINANIPGSYILPAIRHPAQASMAPATMSVGGKSYKAALPWTQLPAAMLARTSFLHHSTYTNSHADAAKVNTLMGAVQRQEMLISLLAKHLAPCLGTVQTQPVVLSPNLVTFNGAVMPTLSPPNLRDVLVRPTGPLANLQQIRDTNLDKLNELLKQSGNLAQKKLIDQYAQSQREARGISQDLLDALTDITGNSREDLNIAAAVLFKMKVSPVVVGRYDFGGDNHADTGLVKETAQTLDSTAAMAHLYNQLTTHGMTDKVTIAFQNVFGRTLGPGSGGRDHNGNHSCTIIIGSAIKSSVIGGIVPATKDFKASGFDSNSGEMTESGDVAFGSALASVGKTLGRAVGISQTVLDDQISKGKVIPAALV